MVTFFLLIERGSIIDCVFVFLNQKAHYLDQESAQTDVARPLDPALKPKYLDHTYLLSLK